jgi:uncharacterized membrane protein
MADPDRDELERRIAELTERVYKLEQLLRVRPPETRKAAAEDRPVVPVKLFAAKPAQAETHSLEAVIGGQWLNRVGVVAVLFGVSYFLKYAFDNNWVGPSIRVVTGLISGLSVVVFGEFIRRRGHVAFSYSLTAVGIGVIYLALWASSQLFGIVPNSLAFAAMIAVTAAAVGLALWQDAEIVAAFATLGAFITPVILSTGENRPVSLFSYIAVVNLGVFVLLRLCPWHRLVVGSYVGTTILYSGWHGTFYTPDQFWIALSFTTLFMAGFAAVPWIVRTNRDSSALLAVALLNAGSYFLEVYELFDHSGSRTNAAIAAVGLGCVYFILARALSNAPAVTRNLHWVTGITMFIVAVPVGLNSHWITIGWFVQAAGLLWVGERTGTPFVRHIGAVALGLGVLRLLVIDNFDVGRLLLNHRFVTFTVAIAVVGLAARETRGAITDYERHAHTALTIVMNVLALYALNLEIDGAYSRELYAGGSTEQRTLVIFRDFAYSALWIAYGACLMAFGFWKKSQNLRWQALVLIGVTIGKVFLYDTASLDAGYRIISFVALGLLLLTTSFLYQRERIKVRP